MIFCRYLEPLAQVSWSKVAQKAAEKYASIAVQWHKGKYCYNFHRLDFIGHRSVHPRDTFGAEKDMIQRQRNVHGKPGADGTFNM